KELKIWSKLVNPNVLPLLGFVVDGDSFPALVAEWMDNGTILNYINANMQADILYLVRGIASGLAYLHQSKVVHADLKSDNILISPEGAPLLTDFGISRTLVVTHTFTGLSNLMGSVRWMATELLAVAQTEDTDIWAFGMVVYELLTMNHPYYGMSEVQAMFRIAAGKLP
ncbi:kinase-like protein, partial [Rickenella mellea]